MSKEWQHQLGFELRLTRRHMLPSTHWRFAHFALLCSNSTSRLSLAVTKGKGAPNAR